MRRAFGHLAASRPRHSDGGRGIRRAEDQEEGAGVVGERPRGGRGDGAEEARPRPAPRSKPGPDPPALDDPRAESRHRHPQHEGRGVAAEAVDRELEPALDDLGELTKPPRPEDRAGQVSVAAQQEVDSDQCSEGDDRYGD